MRDDLDPDDAAITPTPIDRRLRAIDLTPIPPNLLDDCLTTIPPSDRAVPTGRRHGSRWRRRMAAAAASVIVLGTAALLTRPHRADAASLLQAVQTAGIKVPTSHVVSVRRGPDDTRRVESWYVRNKGRREETRVGDKLTLIVIRGQRWEFRWDVPGHLVAAWSTEMNAGHHRADDIDGVVQDGDAMTRWAESHRAEVRVEPDTIGGRRLRKITLNWPGPPNGGSFPRGETIWCDPETLRPVRQHVEFDDGRSIELQMDYPAPEAIPDDLIAFRPPSDVTLEINDPDLGRQVYSEARIRTPPPQPHDQPGGQR
jgi:hypothetical protein